VSARAGDEPRPTERKGRESVVVGAGPNGLSAAIVLASRGWRVRVIEATETIGGGCRTGELTLPGFRHDICSAIHPLALASPFLRELQLDRHGLVWIHPDAPLAHPLDDGRAAIVERSVEATAHGLGADGPAYRRLMQPLVAAGDRLVREFLAPLRAPRHPYAMARFGLKAIRSATGLAGRFRDAPARALVAGVAAHSMLPLDRSPTAALFLAFVSIAHRAGWPMARGGAQAIADAMAGHLAELGGLIETGRDIETLDELPEGQTVLLDLSPKGVLGVAGRRFPPRYRRGLSRFRYGPGVCKVDWALDGPIPWKVEECARAGTVHVGGSMEEIAGGEAAVWSGGHPERPFVILAQQSLFDPSRAPQGKHTGWAYCHVPSGSTVDVADRIEAQVERFAPGFRDLIRARHVRTASEMEAYNPNYVGGDINGGLQDLRQLFARPVARWSPYSTPADGIYLCSSSTPPGGGVHGMCGYHAARRVLRDFS
jgi:phytoene dehydrogenase-like protein